MSRTDSAGRRRYLDAYFEEWGVHVEIDGEQHDEARARWADMRRQNDLWVAGTGCCASRRGWSAIARPR